MATLFTVFESTATRSDRTEIYSLFQSFSHANGIRRRRDFKHWAGVQYRQVIHKVPSIGSENS